MRRMRNLRRGVRSLVVGLIIVAVASVSATAGAGTGAGGGVMPPAAQPHGVSRADMTEALALFSISGNDPALLPDTPAQVLYADPATISFTPDGSGLLQTGSNAFTVRAGDVVLRAGVQRRRLAAGHRRLSDDQRGSAELLLRSRATRRPGLPDRDRRCNHAARCRVRRRTGHHAAVARRRRHAHRHARRFLHPMAPGIHTVTISGGVFGAALLPAVGISFLRESFTYQIDVER